MTCGSTFATERDPRPGRHQHAAARKTVGQHEQHCRTWAQAQRRLGAGKEEPPVQTHAGQRPFSARYVRAARSAGRSVSAPAVSASSCL